MRERPPYLREVAPGDAPEVVSTETQAEVAGRLARESRQAARLAFAQLVEHLDWIADDAEAASKLELADPGLREYARQVHVAIDRAVGGMHRLLVRRP